MNLTSNDATIVLKPWSEELSAQIKLELQRKEEIDRTLELIETGSPKESDSNDDDNDTSEGNSGTSPQNELKGTNILQSVWNEFGNKGKGNKRPETKNEVTETCAICMEDYDEHEEVVIGANCGHLYHKNCLLKWMQAKHDFCPFCRAYSFSVPDFVQVAREQLGEVRFNELIQEDDPDLVAMYLPGALETTASTAGEGPVVEDC